MKKFLLTLLMLTSAFSMMQAENNVLLLHLKDGSQHVYAFNDEPKITFQGSTVHVTSNTISTDYDVADLDRYSTAYHDTPTSAELVDAANFLFREIRNGIYEIHGEGLNEVNVYDISGNLVERFSGEGTIIADISEKQTGVYILQAIIGGNAKTVKTTKR